MERRVSEYIFDAAEFFVRASPYLNEVRRDLPSATSDPTDIHARSGRLPGLGVGYGMVKKRNIHTHLDIYPGTHLQWTGFCRSWSELRLLLMGQNPRFCSHHSWNLWSPKNGSCRQLVITCRYYIIHSHLSKKAHGDNQQRLLWPGKWMRRKAANGMHWWGVAATSLSSWQRRVEKQRDGCVWKWWGATK